MARKIINILSTVFLVVLIMIVVIVFITRINGKTPSLFGYTIFRVQTDSMEPTLMVGDVIIDKKVDADEIQKGDIITYDCLEGTLAGQTITHRVVADPIVRNDEYFYMTMGDKEGATMDPEVSFSQVEGKYLNNIPLVGVLYTFFLSPAGLITFIGIIIILFGYEMISLVLAYRAVDEHDDDYYEPKPKKPSKKRKKK